MSKRLYNVNELAAILGFTVPAIHAHLARKNYDAVPPHFYLGRRLVWSVEAVDQWLAAKFQGATANGHHREESFSRPVGRPKVRNG